MAVINNTATEIGDVLLITVNVPVVGLTSLTSFVDSVIGETGTRYFTREFRYSIDGLNFSLWQTLTNANLLAIDISPAYAFRVQYRYTRAGTDPTGVLEFENVELLGTSTPTTCPQAYLDSIFNQFFSCYSIDVLNWCLNVLEKVYKKGIVPKYIDRGGNENFDWEDKDFIDFWRTVCCYFAVVVNYGRQFQNFPNNSLLLVEYIKSKGLYISEDQSEEDLLYLMEYFWDEMRKRGTLQIATTYQAIDVDESSSSVPGGSVNLLDGELLRLITKAALDEFIFCYVEPWKVGWNVNNSSPLHRGINSYYNAIKILEKSEDVLDLAKYSLYTTETPSNIDLYVTGGRSYMRISPFAAPGGFGGIGMATFDPAKAIIINPSIDYEVTFTIIVTPGNIPDIDFGVRGYSDSGALMYHTNIVSGVNDNLFFTAEKVNLVSQEYFVRGIIYNESQALLSVTDGRPKIGFGTHLRTNKSVKYIYPILIVHHEAGAGNILLRDIKVRPLTTDGGTCFVGVKNYLVTWMKNNTVKYTEEQIETIMRQKLLPYNLPFKNKYL